MDENRRLLGLDREIKRRKKGSKRFGKKEKVINWIFKKGRLILHIL